MNQNLPISQSDFKLLEQAVYLLESQSLAIQMSNVITGVVENFALNKIPDGVQEKIIGISKSALDRVFDIASISMQNKRQDASPLLHKFAAATTGGVGGFFGLSAILIELPISTTIMMRSILDIARAEGFSIDDHNTRLECIKVFGFEGNKSVSDDSAEAAYYTARVGLDAISKVATKVVKGAAENTAEKNLHKVIFKLIEVVSRRFGVTLSEQAMLKAIPILGSALGATLNVMFTDFYQDMAKGHFTVLKLEKKYSKDVIQNLYEEIYQHMEVKRIGLR